MSTETEYVEGALYRARFGLRDGTFSYVKDGAGAYLWLDIHKYAWFEEGELTDIVGPLRVLGPDERVVEPGQVVLDVPSDLDSIEKALGIVGYGALRYLGHTVDKGAIDVVDDFIGPILDAMRDATKSPRIPEPGFGAVVEAGVKGREGRHLFVRVIVNGFPMWQSQDGRTWVTWDSLIDPVIVREGVES